MNTADNGAASADAPPGYTTLKTLDRGFVRLVGPFFLHDERPVLATRITPDHLNSIGIVHGGFLATLADTAFGAVLRRQLSLPAPPATASLSVDYIGAVREGDWLEAHVDVHKVGGRLTNASCLLKVGERLVLRASGIFVMSVPGTR
ncbi:PaaI family thioesterase [Variovorax sp. J22R133]|uniref:PaaI family thioesterase n=1 Tax=Variovorax brevis TaxID=3053503 RepID=UPI002577A2BD|nr:PaaI family thioesterase [Variovorax sp. J22R133]MDM0114013.1 PaaI family thioesterase [Variovorax sp. J22R133]